MRKGRGACDGRAPRGLSLHDQRDAFPAADVGLHNAIKQGLRLTHKPDLLAVHPYAEPWQGWRGYATFYLWQTLLP